ncbi:MAG: hypothetical protein F6K45_24370, partial [Kamptonema sp. SIO1D9]|nr:hypothetical protein [Kamptonema sp. SIO1D9]
TIGWTWEKFQNRLLATSKATNKKCNLFALIRDNEPETCPELDLEIKSGDYISTDEPEDYVIGTGKLHAVRELVATAFECVDLNWEQYVQVNPKFFRPDEHFQLVADPTKAKTNLGWEPQVSFEALIEKMVKKDLEYLQAKNF